MGLDIIAYRQVMLIENAECNSDGYPIDADNQQRIYANSAFPGREEGIADGAIYDYRTESYGFGAGSYSTYNHWRDELAKFANYPQNNSDPNYPLKHAQGAWKATGGPFWELINFADCEGVIGPVVSAKLAQDFAQFDAVAAQNSTLDFYACYQDWRRAFDIAADGGFVKFC